MPCYDSEANRSQGLNVSQLAAIACSALTIMNNERILGIPNQAKLSELSGIPLETIIKWFNDHREYDKLRKSRV